MKHSRQMIDFLRTTCRKARVLCAATACIRIAASWCATCRLEAYFTTTAIWTSSTLKELAARWAPEVKKSFQKKTRHTALADVYESIDELKHYRDHFIRLPAGGASDGCWA